MWWDQTKRDTLWNFVTGNVETWGLGKDIIVHRVMNVLELEVVTVQLSWNLILCSVPSTRE